MNETVKVSVGPTVAGQLAEVEQFVERCINYAKGINYKLTGETYPEAPEVDRPEGAVGRLERLAMLTSDLQHRLDVIADLLGDRRSTFVSDNLPGGRLDREDAAARGLTSR